MSEIEEFRVLLRARRAALAGTAPSEEAGAVELDQARVGRVSRADAMQAHEMARASDRRRLGEIRRIDAALARIDDDEFGWCLRCGERIPAARLRVDPAATLCVACAGRAEGRT